MRIRKLGRKLYAISKVEKCDERLELSATVLRRTSVTICPACSLFEDSNDQFRPLLGWSWT